VLPPPCLSLVARLLLAHPLTLSFAFVNCAQSDARGFHPNGVNVSVDIMCAWLTSVITTGDLTQVPGIGQDDALKLSNVGINNVRELCRIIVPSGSMLLDRSLSTHTRNLS
jgi:hypothetical protein